LEVFYRARDSFPDVPLIPLAQLYSPHLVGLFSSLAFVAFSQLFSVLRSTVQASLVLDDPRLAVMVCVSHHHHAPRTPERIHQIDHL
jgi:hypothetical protein